MAQLAAEQYILFGFAAKYVTAGRKIRFPPEPAKLHPRMGGHGGQSEICVSLLIKREYDCRWTDSLALFLKNLHSRFVRRLYLEHLPKGASTESDMDDAEEDNDENNDEKGDIAGFLIITLSDHSVVPSQHEMCP